MPKLKSAFHHNLNPIVCVGESLEQREAGHTLDWITSQLKGALADIPKEQVESTHYCVRTNLGYWYWQRPQQLNKLKRLCKAIRDYIRSLYDDDAADAVRIQYGGSVKSENALEILGRNQILTVLL